MEDNMYKIYSLRNKESATILGYDFIIVTGKRLERVAHVKDMQWGDNRLDGDCYEYITEAICIDFTPDEKRESLPKYSEILMDEDLVIDLLEYYELIRIVDDFYSVNIVCSLNSLKQ